LRLILIEKLGRASKGRKSISGVLFSVFRPLKPFPELQFSDFDPKNGFPRFSFFVFDPQKAFSDVRK
jgi:hypothetical protein